MPTIHRASGLDEDEIEDIIEEMGDDRWIEYKENQRSCGYWVKIEERSVRHLASFFSLSVYGCKPKAKKAAIKFRNEFIRKHFLVPSELVGNIPSRRYVKSDNFSGLPGVRLSLSSSGKEEDKGFFGRWVAHTDKGPISFGISKYGYYQAYLKALEVRLTYLKQSDDMDMYNPLPRTEVEKRFKERYGANWKSLIFSYDKWWRDEDPEIVKTGRAELSTKPVQKSVEYRASSF
jgi:hypothetical protein